MEITASMVKQLREMTGAGVMACKNALVETEGNFDAAVEVLRKKGEATAVKKAGRIAAEGTVLAYVDGNKAAIVEVNSETDFVAKNDTFRTFVADIAEQIIASNATTVEALSDEKFIKDESKTVKEELVSKIAVIGENLTIRRFEKINTDGMVVPYIHAGGKIGVLVEAATANTGDDVKEALKNIAMQIAALSPKYAVKEEISAEELDKMREIAPSIQYHASNPDWQLVSYMILYMFQCHSPKSSHLLPLPQSPKDCSIHQCPFCFNMENLNNRDVDV